MQGSAEQTASIIYAGKHHVVMNPVPHAITFLCKFVFTQPRPFDAPLALS